MGKISLDSCEYECPQEVINAFGKLKTDSVTLNTQIETLTKERDTLAADRDTLKVKCDSFEKRNFSKEVSDAVKARRVLESASVVVVDKAVSDKFDGMSDAEIRLAVIAKQFPEIKCDGQSETYIEGCFQAAVVAAKSQRKADASATNRQKSTEKEDSCGGSKDGGAKSSYEKYKERTQNAYKGEQKK